jgi:hypothetical protein
LEFFRKFDVPQCAYGRASDFDARRSARSTGVSRTRRRLPCPLPPLSNRASKNGGTPRVFRPRGVAKSATRFSGRESAHPLRHPTASPSIELDDSSRRRPAEGYLKYLQTRRRPRSRAPSPAASPRKSTIRSRHAFLFRTYELNSRGFGARFGARTFP